MTTNTTTNAIDDDHLYDKAEVARRAKVSIRALEKHAQDPTCPLKFGGGRGRGRRMVCTAETLRAYLAWRVGA